MRLSDTAHTMVHGVRHAHVLHNGVPCLCPKCTGIGTSVTDIAALFAAQMTAVAYPAPHFKMPPLNITHE